MESRWIVELKKELAEYEREYANLKRRLARAPAGNLRTRKLRGKVRFSVIETGPDGHRHERYVSSSNAIELTKYGTKYYCKGLEPVLAEQIGILRQFADRYDPDAKFKVFASLPEFLQKYVVPICLTHLEQAEEWADESHQCNSFPIPCSSAYKSQKGDIVRSRAECLAVNTLFGLNLPYRYEDVLELDGRDAFPDITVMHPETLELWYIEIFGMMGDPDYARDAFLKIQRYQRAGLGGRLLAFFDYPDVPFDPSAFERTIRAIFLPD